MNITEVQSRQQKNKYLEFMDLVYRDNKYYKNVNSFFARNFLFQEDLFARRCDIKPVLIYDNGEVAACATCVTYDGSDELFLSFFESLPNKYEAVDFIIRYAKERANKCVKNKIIIGINGHISYSVGILINNFDQPQSFDAAYNPDYYPKYFEKYATSTKEACTYAYDLNKIKFDQQALLDVYSHYSFRYLDKVNFKKDLLIFGDLCDRAMKGTPYYFQKTKEEMYESLKPLRLVFKKHDLIFALKDGREIGFLLMHPDYNQACLSQKMTPPKILLSILIRSKKIDTMVLNIVGVLPEFQNNRVVIGLLNEAYQIISPRYSKAISTFIFKDNLKSTGLCRNFSSGELNKYLIYEIDV